MNEFRCPICGGELSLEDKDYGIAKCLYCGNKTKVELGLIKDMPAAITTPQVEQKNNLFETTSKEEIEKKLKDKSAISMVKFSNISILLMGITILFYALYLVFLIIKQDSTQIVQSLIVLGIAFVFSIVCIMFSKIKVNNIKLSNFVTSFKLIFIFLIFAFLVYLSIIKYIII